MEWFIEDDSAQSAVGVEITSKIACSVSPYRIQDSIFGPSCQFEIQGIPSPMKHSTKSSSLHTPKLYVSCSAWCTSWPWYFFNWVGLQFHHQSLDQLSDALRTRRVFWQDTSCSEHISIRQSPFPGPTSSKCKAAACLLLALQTSSYVGCNMFQLDAQPLPRAHMLCSSHVCNQFHCPALVQDQPQ